MKIAPKINVQVENNIYMDSRIYLLLKRQSESFPALCKNSRGKIRLTGRETQDENIRIAHLSISLSRFVVPRATVKSVPRQDIRRAAIMAVMVRKAFCFDRFICCLSPPISPGPGRTRTQRTEKLQKDTITKETRIIQKHGIYGTLG